MKHPPVKEEQSIVIDFCGEMDLIGKYFSIRIRGPEKNRGITTSVAEPKLFISGSAFDHNFGSGSSSSYSHILALKTVLKHYSTILIEVEITFSSS